MDVITERNKQIYKQRKEGKTLQEIATYFGMTRQRIHQIINQFRSEK